MKWLALIFVLVAISAAEARDPKQVTAFKKANACPSTQEKGDKPCPGYVVDHKYPLGLGGEDTPDNMMWQTIADSYIKDRIEREAIRWKQMYEELKAAQTPKLKEGNPYAWP